MELLFSGVWTADEAASPCGTELALEVGAAGGGGGAG